MPLEERIANMQTSSRDVAAIWGGHNSKVLAAQKLLHNKLYASEVNAENGVNAMEKTSDKTLKYFLDESAPPWTMLDKVENELLRVVDTLFEREGEKTACF